MDLQHRAANRLARSSAFRVSTAKGDQLLVNSQYEPLTPFAKPKSNFLRLPDKYSFDIEEARAASEEVFAEYPAKPFELRPGKPKTTYKGVGLTSRPDAEDPVYDALRVIGADGKQVNVDDVLASASERNTVRRFVPIDESEFAVPTPAMHPFFRELTERFDSQVTKVRLNVLEPGGVLASHVDFPYYQFIRLHAVLHTNDHVRWECNGENRMIYPNGSFYWMDVGNYHAVWNFGTTPRIVFSLNLKLPQYAPASLMEYKDSGVQIPSLEYLIQSGLL